MISFENDYICGAHPKVLERIADINLDPQTGYGYDKYTESAKEKIRKACECPEAGVYFLVGGTQTNMVVIDSLLKTYEGVVAATTGHISIHEAGAIEHSGHKVLTVPSHDGKIAVADLKELLVKFYADDTYEHMVFPGMVYISFATETGTLYSKQELTEIHNICKEYNIPLFIDGARLAYALMSPENDITLPELARLCEVFYIGGTKCGTLFGEAVVFSGIEMPKHFLGIAKQRGALLAKGKLLGIQFDTLFTDDLYFKIGEHAIKMAKQLVDIFEEKGYQTFTKSPTNQQFFIVDNETKERLSKQVGFSFWDNIDENHTAIRFVTSWSTTEEDVLALRDIL